MVKIFTIKLNINIIIINDQVFLLIFLEFLPPYGPFLLSKNILQIYTNIYLPRIGEKLKKKRVLGCFYFFFQGVYLSFKHNLKD